MSEPKNAMGMTRAARAFHTGWMLLVRLSTLGVRLARPFGRKIRQFREADGQAATGMNRLIDVHAVSCAADALVAVGLAGTIFFDVPVGEARSRVALYLLVTMAPFALLAPIVGPVLDRFQHGRRYALATTMLARAFLAYGISYQLDSFFLYPAAFGVLVMSRAYGVARSAAIPRLLPPGLGLVSANARGSLAGTISAAVLAPAGLLIAAMFGPSWTLRAATLVFLVAMVISLKLPPRADSDLPETVPGLFRFGAARGARQVLAGLRVRCAITACWCFRALYGFLTLFFAFRTREDDFGVAPTLALGLVIGGLGLGSFVATALGTRLSLRHPLELQLAALVVAALACLLATLLYGLLAVVTLGLLAALGSGLAKLAVDAIIQTEIPERIRASAFSHSETLLQLGFVAGGTVGLLPIPGPVGLGLATLGLGLGGSRVGSWVWSLRVQARSAPDTGPVA